MGDLCEIGNASILMPGAVVGDRVFLGEGTLVPAGMTLPSDIVAVGRPARVIRSASVDDRRRLAGLRDGDLSVPPRTAVTVEQTEERAVMGQLYEYRGILPTIAASAVLFPTTEITGDVVVGEHSIIGAGSIIEPGAIVCDGSVLGTGCVVRAGAVVKQRSHFAAGTEIDDFPAVDIGHLSGMPETPAWALRRDDLPVPAPPRPASDGPGSAHRT